MQSNNDLFQKFKQVHGVLDGLYLFYSILEYLSDVSDNAAELDFLANPELWPLLIAGALFLAYSSILGNSAKNKGSAIESNWLYFRDGLSGLKNGRKAMLNMVSILQQLGTVSGKFMNPIGIAVGVLQALNAVWYRHKDGIRDTEVAKNEKLLTDITENYLTNEELVANLISSQSVNSSKALFASAFSDGVGDGSYLYGCLFTIVALGTVSFPPAILTVAIIVIAVYIACAVITKLAEEYDKQQKLQRSIDLCKLQLQHNRLNLAKQDYNNATSTLDNVTHHTIDNTQDITKNAYFTELTNYTLLQQDFDKKYNTTPITAAVKPGFWLLRGFWLFARGVLSGAKNTVSVVNFVSIFMRKIVVSCLKLAAMIIIGVGYATYLGLDAVAKIHKKYAEIRKQRSLTNKPAPSTLPVTFFKNAASLGFFKVNTPTSTNTTTSQSLWHSKVK